MAAVRLTYWELPFAIRTQVEQTTGMITATKPAPAGRNSAIAELLHTPARGFFLKALPTRHPTAWTQSREADLAPHLREVAPKLLARVVDDGWDVLVFEGLPGRHANFEPGSRDLRIVAALLARLGTLPSPAGIELFDAPQRLRPYTDDADLHHFAGHTLLHTDLDPANIIIGANGGHLVDWSSAARGAAWLDPACWVVRLITAGHTRPAQNT